MTSCYLTCGRFRLEFNDDVSVGKTLFLELDNANFIQKAAEVLTEERFELVEASVEDAVDHGRSIKHILEVEPAVLLIRIDICFFEFLLHQGVKSSNTWSMLAKRFVDPIGPGEFRH